MNQNISLPEGVELENTSEDCYLVKINGRPVYSFHYDYDDGNAYWGDDAVRGGQTAFDTKQEVIDYAIRFQDVLARKHATRYRTESKARRVIEQLLG